MRKFNRIKGISEIRRIPRRGKIHLGEKKMSEKGVEYPSATEHFVCPDEVVAVYGETPTELDIMFPSEDVDEIFPQKLTYWKASGCYCRGDGEEAERLVESDKEGERVYKDYPCKGKDCEDFGPRKCRFYANLMVMIPSVSIDGVYQIDTGSYHSIVNINSALDHIRKLFGRISNLLDTRTHQTLLVLRRIKVETHGGGQKATHDVMTIGIKPSAPELLEMRSHVDNNLLALPGGDTERVIVEEPEAVPEYVQCTKVETETIASPYPTKGDYDPTEENAQRLDIEIALGDMLTLHFGKTSRNKAAFLKEFGAEKMENLTLENLKKAHKKVEKVVGTAASAKSQSSIPF